MSKLDKTELIEYVVFSDLFLKKLYRVALEVRIPRIGRRVDVIGINKQREIINVEIKVTKADFKSDHGHTFIGHKNYYAMPQELYDSIDKKDIPKGVGVMICSVSDRTLRKGKTITNIPNVKIVKPATTKKDVLTPKQVNAIEKNMITAMNSNIRRLLKFRADIITKDKPN